MNTTLVVSSSVMSSVASRRGKKRNPFGLFPAGPFKRGRLELCAATHARVPLLLLLLLLEEEEEEEEQGLACGLRWRDNVQASCSGYCG